MGQDIEATGFTAEAGPSKVAANGGVLPCR
jgi:hypothetical protein